MGVKIICSEHVGTRNKKKVFTEVTLRKLVKKQTTSLRPGFFSATVDAVYADSVKLGKLLLPSYLKRFCLLFNAGLTFSNAGSEAIICL